MENIFAVSVPKSYTRKVLKVTKCSVLCILLRMTNAETGILMRLTFLTYVLVHKSLLALRVQLSYRKKEVQLSCNFNNRHPRVC